jgi:prephenate dehydrogenase
MPPPVLVDGLGLMGGSLAAALSRAGRAVLLMHRRPEVAAEAERRGWGIAINDPAQAAQAELAVVCTPVDAIPGEARRLARAGVRLITDVGSTKAGLARALADLGGAYVGSHPMCGSHKQGLAHADASLYHGSLAIVTPTDATTPEALAAVEGLWRAVGCRILRLPPAEHDRVVAEASHLPHLLASAAAAQLSAGAAPVAASGFRDSTRVAAGSPRLWAEIVLSNAEAIGGGLACVRTRLAELEGALARGDRAAVEAWLAAGADGRARFERDAQATGG